MRVHPGSLPGRSELRRNAWVSATSSWRAPWTPAGPSGRERTIPCEHDHSEQACRGAGVPSTHADSLRCALAEVVSAYLEAGDFTSSSRATYHRVLGELARHRGAERLADSITVDGLVT